MFVDKAADVDMAKKVVVDAKIDYPAACNAMETLLIHEDLVKNKEANKILDALKIAGKRFFLKAVFPFFFAGHHPLVLTMEKNTG